MSYKMSTYTKPLQSQKLLMFPSTTPKKKEPSLYLTTVLKSHTDPHSSVKYKKQSLGSIVAVNASKLSKAEYDAKIKASGQKLKNKYDQMMKAKHCSKIISMKDRPQIIMSITEPVCKKQTKKKQPVQTKTVCMSTLKSGKPCTAPAKKGSKFCGRHGA